MSWLIHGPRDCISLAAEVQDPEKAGPIRPAVFAQRTNRKFRSDAPLVPAEVVARRIFWKQLNVMGSTMGSPADFRSMVDFVGQHSIRPVIDTAFPFEEGEAAMRRMDEAQQFGKIVIKI